MWTSKLKEPLWSAVFVESRAMTSLTAWFPCKSDVGGNHPFIIIIIIIIPITNTTVLLVVSVIILSIVVIITVIKLKGCDL